jgi:hypothetical protein
MRRAAFIKEISDQKVNVEPGVVFLEALWSLPSPGMNVENVINNDCFTVVRTSLLGLYTIFLRI